MNPSTWLHPVLAITLAMAAGNAVASDVPQTDGDWTPRRFLEVVKYIANDVDLEDDATVARLLRIELLSRERPSPGKDMLLKSQQTEYLTKVSYRVSLPLEEEGGRKRMYIGLWLKHEAFCVQLEDALAVLGDRYEVPRPKMVDYWTPDGAVDGEAIARELKARDGRFDAIEYPHIAPRQGVAIDFSFRRCARIVWISRLPPNSK